MSQNITIKVRENEFVVRDGFVSVLEKVANGGAYAHIQDLICKMLPLQSEWMSAEFAAVVHLVFPESTIPNRAQARATADVRKYNGGEFKVQGGKKPEKPVKLLDAGQQTRSMASDINDALKNMKDLLNQ